MDKTFRIALASLLLASGCSRSYQGERLLWRAQRASRAVLEKPNQASAEQASQAITSLETVVREAAGTQPAAQAQLLIAYVYARRGQTQEARAVYEQVLRTQSQQPRALLSAMTALAALEAGANDVPAAKQRLWDIAERFPWTEAGVLAPSEAARLEERAAGQAAADWERAAQWYARKVSGAPSPLFEAALRDQLAAVYQRLERWEDARRELEQLSQSKEKSVNKAKFLYDLALLYSSRLDNIEKSRELLQEIATRYPQDPFGRAAQARLDGK